MPRTTTDLIPAQFRLSPESLAGLDRLSEHFGLGSRSAALRLAVSVAVSQLPETKSDKTKKKPKKSGE